MTGDAPVMQVRYGLHYSLLFFFSGFVLIGLAILMAMTMETFIEIAVLPAVAGVGQLAMAVLSRRRAYFEVFENRIEFLSPVFPGWRRAKPLTSINSFTLNLHRLVARQEDIKRFIAWHEAGCLRRGDAMESGR